jgi:hypothetical protein
MWGRQKRVLRRISMRKREREKIIITNKIKNEEMKLYKNLYSNDNLPRTIHNSIDFAAQKQCYDSYGYTADLSKPLWENIEHIFVGMNKFEYFSRPCQIAYHKLCKTLSPLCGIGITLGLGLKFCI